MLVSDSEASGSVCGEGGGGGEVWGYSGFSRLGDLPSSADPREVQLWEEVCIGDRAWEKSQCSFWTLWKFPGRFHAGEIYPSSAGVAANALRSF